MTRAEIETAALSLPREERTALLEALHSSLKQAGGLSEEERQELEALEAEIQPRLESAFRGEARTWEDEDWQGLLRGEYRHPPDPESEAVPLPWRSPRAVLRQ